MASKLVSNVAGELLPANASRKSLFIQNEDTVDTVYIKRERSEFTTVSATDHDIRLGPGAATGLNSLLDGSNAIQARYTVIASANTPRVAYFETEDIQR
jgi:hypothetical protein